MNEEPSVVRDSPHRVIAVCEHDRAEQEGSRDMYAGQCDSDTTSDKRAIARCVHHEFH